MSISYWKPVIVLPLLAGCYQYVETNRVGLEPSTPVAVDLSTRGSLNVADKIGANVESVEGYVTEATPAGLTLALNAVRRKGENAPSTWSGESIRLGADDIDQVKRRQLSRQRTAVASAALVAASVGIVIGIAKANGAAEGSVGGKPTPNP